jgi:hypothetical protein
MELVNRDENVMPRSRTQFSRAHREASFSRGICAWVVPGQYGALAFPPRGASRLCASASLRACQEKAIGEQSCVSTPHARIALAIYRSCVIIDRRIDQKIRSQLALQKNDSQREAHPGSKKRMDRGWKAEGRVDLKTGHPRNRQIQNNLVGTNLKANRRISILFSQLLKNKRLNINTGKFHGKPHRTSHLGSMLRFGMTSTERQRRVWQRTRTGAAKNLARGKSEEKGQKIYTPSSQPIQNTRTLEERNQKQNHF